MEVVEQEMLECCCFSFFSFFEKSKVKNQKDKKKRREKKIATGRDSKNLLIKVCVNYMYKKYDFLLTILPDSLTF